MNGINEEFDMIYRRVGKDAMAEVKDMSSAATCEFQNAFSMLPNCRFVC
jgi:hypothetical protein